MIYKLYDFRNWTDLKAYILEHARLQLVYGKNSSVNLAETPVKVDEVFLARTDDMSMDKGWRS